MNQIKKEIQSINRSNTAFGYIVQDPNIAKLTKALSVAVEELERCKQFNLGNIMFSKPHYALKVIAEILSGEGEIK